MRKKFNLKIFIIIMFTILVFLYLIIFNMKKNTKVEIQAEVSKVGTNYVIVVDGDKNEYLLNTGEQYNVGDKLNVVLKNVKKGNPYTGEVIKIDTVSKNVIFSITDKPVNKEDKNDDKDNDAVVNGSNNEVVNETNEDKVLDNNDLNNVSIVNDEQVVAYFTNFSREIDGTDNFKGAIKDKFVLIVDFLFYDGMIGEKTFAELSDQTKLKVLEISLEIDQKIEKKFPGYKESISSSSSKIYTNVKNKIVSSYLDITTNICKDNAELCSSAKEGLGELKKSFSLTWDFIKEAAGTGLGKLKSWYEVWREA